MDMDRISNTKSIDFKVTKVFQKNLEALLSVDINNRPKYKFIINSGSSRSSKSISVLQILFLQAIQTKKSIVISMQTLKQLKDTIIKEDIGLILKQIDEIIEYKYNKSEQVIYFNNGSKISFIGFDDESKAKGVKSDLLFIDEVNEVNPEILKQLFIRNTGQIFLAYNPSGDLSFLNEIKEREDAKHIHSTYKDNPFLSKEQVAEIESYRGKDNRFWRIYGLGHPAPPQEAVYSHFQPTSEKPYNKYSNYIYGLDFSITRSPLVKIWYSPDSADVYIEEVFYGSDVGVSDLIDLLELHNIDFETPIIADSASPMAIKDIRKKGYNIIPTNKKKYTVLDGINFIKMLNVFYDEKYSMLELELNNYKFKKIGNHQTEIVIQKYDDCLDSVRYAMMYLRDHRLIAQNRAVGKQTRKFFKF